jgi:hypothetical protein
MTEEPTQADPDIWEDEIFMGKLKRDVAKNLPAPVITKAPVPLRDNSELRYNSKTKEIAVQLQRPENRGAVENKGVVKPYELDAELAQLKLAELMIGRLPCPSKVNKAFIARKAIWEALNNTQENQTGYDCSIRIRLYDQFALQSVNEEGMYFERFWAFMMKPKYIINGMQQGQIEEKESIIGRAIGWFRGKPKEQTQQGGM